MIIPKSFPPFKYRVVKYEDEKCIKITDFDNSVLNPTIPSNIEGLPVRVIGSSAFNHSDIESVQMPNTLLKIDAGAFEFCKELKEICFPDSAKLICSEVCRGCSSLESVKWSKSDMTIPHSAFKYCRKLKEISNIDSVTIFSSSAFEETGLSSFTIPPDTKHISEYVFANCPNLKVIKMEHLPYVSENAFYGSKNISIDSKHSTEVKVWAELSHLPIYKDSKLRVFLANIDSEEKDNDFYDENSI